MNNVMNNVMNNDLVRNIISFIQKRPLISTLVSLFVVMLVLAKLRPKFLYDLLSTFYSKEKKEGFSFENLQKIMREEKEKETEL